jgi:hypothetical protein
MKTTRILGFAAGLMAVIALLAMGLGAFLAMNPVQFPNLSMNYGILGLGAIIMVVSLVPGIAHLLFRIKFRRPYERRRRDHGAFLKLSRVLVWIWGVAVLATLALALYLTPMLVSFLTR